MPPVRFDTFVKPACLRASAALWLRAPDLQWTTISRSFLSASSSGAAFDLSDWDEWCAEIYDLVLVRLADVEDEYVFLCVELALQLLNGDLWDSVDYGKVADSLVSRDFEGANLAWRGDAAELVVVDQLGHGRVGAADGALGIFAQLQGAEAHAERVDQQQTADERLADAEDQLDGLGGLDDSDEAGQDAEYATLSAGGNQPWRWRLGVEAAVARAFLGAEDAGLAFEAEDGAVRVRLVRGARRHR